MTGLITNQHYTFRVGELPVKLAENLRNDRTGYWRFKFDKLAESQPSFYWYLGVANGRILYSGSSLWSSTTLLRLLQRYNMNMRKEEFQGRLNQLKDLVKQQVINPVELAIQLKRVGAITDEQLKQSLYTKILSDCDQYFFYSGGQAEFVADRQLASMLPTDGFDIKIIMAQANVRSAQWSKLKSYVPSLDLIPTLNTTSPAGNFSHAQQIKLASLLQGGGNINKIAIELAKDNIDVAQMFAQLIQAGIVVLNKPRTNVVTKVMVIDDSPLMLKQFRHWLHSANYTVVTCADAAHAVAMIQLNQPDVIFIDINMPVISGFELVKRIRLEPKIASIPIVIVTGEQKLSNKWRAQWGGCEFLSKPMTAGEQQEFTSSLQELIARLMSGLVSAPV